MGNSNESGSYYSDDASIPHSSLPYTPDVCFSSASKCLLVSKTSRFWVYESKTDAPNYAEYTSQYNMPPENPYYMNKQSVSPMIQPTSGYDMAMIKNNHRVQPWTYLVVKKMIRNKILLKKL